MPAPPLDARDFAGASATMAGKASAAKAAPVEQRKREERMPVIKLDRWLQTQLHVSVREHVFRGDKDGEDDKKDEHGVQGQEESRRRAWAAADRPGLPGELPWHGNLRLCELGAEWTVMYEAEGGPVVAARPWRQGTVVLCTDSYLFSNEAMLLDRQPGLLAWIVGPVRSVVVDETLHGVAQSESMGMLARRYGLQGVVLSLIVFGALFVWRNGTSLVPPVESTRGADGARLAARTSSDALVALAQRSVPDRELIRTCCRTWESGLPARDEKAQSRRERVREWLARAEAHRPADRDPVDEYRQLCRLLSEKEKAD